MAKFDLRIGSIRINTTLSMAVTIDSVVLSASLLSLRYHKKMYQPGEVFTRIKLTAPSASTSIPNVIKLEEFFKGVGVSLTVKNEKNVKVAADYYVYRVETELKQDSGNQTVYIDLYCYSLDHKLTVDKYCKTYVNKKLCNNILADEAAKGVLHTTGLDTKINYENIRFLKYMVQNTQNNVTTYGMREFIQPYLVQYNESFFDFLCRTANRCGEYVYYEKGKFYVGLKKSETIRTINSNAVLSIKYEANSLSPLSIKDSYVDTTAKEAVRNTVSSFPFNDEVPMDDYLGMVFKKDGFMTSGEAITKEGWSVVVDLFNFILNMSTPTKMVSKFAAKYAEAILFAGGKQAEANRKGNKKWVVTKYGSDNNSDSKSYEQSSTDKKCINAAEQYDPTTESATLYGSMLTSNDQKLNPVVQLNLNSKFYQFVRKGCESVSRKRIKITLGVDDEPFLLGDEVSLDNVSYIVTEVSEVLVVEDSNSNDPDWQTVQKIIITPYYTIQTEKGTSQYALTMPCPPMEHPFIKTSGAQRAYVAESGDPTKMGRVCIRYPWQQQDDASSPWIRVAVPFAPSNSENGGMLFTPNEGDEVLVDYENGNIERPFVIGSLYNGSVKSPSNKRAIVSERGHSITFNDDDSVEDFMAGILPAFGMLKKYAGMISLGSDIDFGKKNDFCGGISISDKWGLYKIDASATKRNISIQSPFGDVKINAFSGIELSAPNGNITIKGKNVTIEAGNEVSISSGKFIDEKKLTAKSLFNSFAKDLVGNLVDDLAAPFTDFSILRHVWEALLKPVGGTLNIQSGRYLLLNAGGAKAEIPNKGYSIEGMRVKENENYGLKVRISNTIREINTMVDNNISDIWNVYKEIHPLYLNYQTVYDPDITDHKKADDILNDIYTVASYMPEDINVDPTKINQRVTILANANNILAKGATLKGLVNDFVTGAGISEKDKKILGKELKGLIKDCLPPVINNIYTQADKTFDKTEDDFKNVKKKMKRMLIDKLLTKYGRIDQTPLLPTDKVTFANLDAYENEADWSKYISNLGDANLSLGTQVGDMVKDKMTKNIPGVGWHDDRKLWDSCKMGEILMADKGKDETISIVNGALTRTPNNDEYMDGIKTQLRNIK